MVEKIYAKEWWDENVIWKWEVEGKGDVTLDEVVDAFPIWRKWRGMVESQTRRKGLKVEELKYIEEETSASLAAAHATPIVQTAPSLG